MIMEGSAVEGTPFYDKEFMVAIKQGDYYVIRDKFNEITIGDIGEYC